MGSRKQDRRIFPEKTPQTRTDPEVGLPEVGLPEVGLPEVGLPEVGLEAVVVSYVDNTRAVRYVTGE